MSQHPDFFPLWVVVTHFLNIFFMLLLARSGLEVLSAFPKLYWHYLIPTNWSTFPDSIRAVGTYLQFRIPNKIPGQPFEPAQKLAYFLVIFVLAPLQIASGAAMSPSVIGRFPWYARLFGGKQGARSWHFIGLCLFAAFTVLHTVMVLIHGLPNEFVKIVLGQQTGSWQLALAVGFTGLFLMTRLTELVRPLAQATHVVFYAMDDKGLTEGEGRYGFFYGTIPLHLAHHSQTLLALDMNGAPLPAEHGAPVRLRVETQLGFKMVKWITAIEFTDDISGLGMGQGGWREDQQYYANAAGI